MALAVKRDAHAPGGDVKDHAWDFVGSEQLHHPVALLRGRFARDDRASKRLPDRLDSLVEAHENRHGVVLRDGILGERDDRGDLEKFNPTAGPENFRQNGLMVVLGFRLDFRQAGLE